MKTATVTAAFVAGLTAMAGLTACSDLGGSASTSSPSASRSAEKTETVTTAAGASPTTEPSAEPTPDATSSAAPTAEVPNLVGKGLQIAQDQAKAAGFETAPYDAAGQDRTPILYKDWQVCFQLPDSGTASTSTKLQLGVVKASETCPATDKGKNLPTIGADKRLPNFAGTNLQVAMDAVGRSASVNPVDATGGKRNIFISKNWQICSQSPEAGTVWDGQPITFKVVKYDETCPN